MILLAALVALSANSITLTQPYDIRLTQAQLSTEYAVRVVSLPF